jgi:hypothetical protein
MAEGRREALLREYGEVSSNFRLLTDIRFKLPALLPIATALAAVVKGDSLGVSSLPLSLFGLVVTIGLLTYNARNDQLYDGLIGRAASIERSLGLPDGAFANRPQAWLSIPLWGKRKWKVDHRTGVGLIYSASIALWLYGLIAPGLELARRGFLAFAPSMFNVSDPAAWVQISALVVAVCFTYFASGAMRRLNKRRQDEMRSLASRTMARALAVDLGNASGDATLIDLCAALSGLKPEVVRARAAFYAKVDGDSVGHYLPLGPKELSASLLVAQLTDLPPGWLFDCLTDRRGANASD